MAAMVLRWCRRAAVLVRRDVRACREGRRGGVCGEECCGLVRPARRSTMIRARTSGRRCSLGVLVGTLCVAPDLVSMAVGLEGSGSGSFGFGDVAPDGGVVTSEEDGELNIFAWINIVVNSIIVLVGAISVLWHFTTFNSWIDSTLAYAEEAALAGLDMAAGGVSGTIQTAKGGVNTLTDGAASAAQIASPSNIVGTLAKTGHARGGTPRAAEGHERPRSPVRDDAFDDDDDDDVVDMSGSFKSSAKSATPKLARLALQSGGRRAAHGVARGVNDANQVATSTVTTGIKVRDLCIPYPLAVTARWVVTELRDSDFVPCRHSHSKVAGIGANVALSGVDRTVETAMVGTTKSLQMTTKGRQMIMTTTANLSGRVVQKELVRKAGVGLKHQMHVVIDDLVGVFESLPMGWRIVWVSGALVLLVAGLTVLLVIPFSFTVLIALWTFLIVKLAGATSTAEEEDEGEVIMQIRNPLEDLDDKVDDEREESEWDFDSPKEVPDVEEQVVGFTARPPGDQ